MSAWDDLKKSIRKIVLMEEKLNQLSSGLAAMSEQVMDHEKRLIRIETMIELAQTHGGAGPKRLS
jgi:hypothetical protein